jgi:hypothetical protein
MLYRIYKSDAKVAERHETSINMKANLHAAAALSALVKPFIKLFLSSLAQKLLQSKV